MDIFIIQAIVVCFHVVHPDKVQKQRAERPVFGSLLLLISGVIAIFVAFNTFMAIELASFLDLYLADIFVGLALVGVGIVAYVRPALSLMVGVGTVLYIVLAIIFPASFTQPVAMWVSVLGALLCISWASTHTHPKLTEMKPTS